MSPEGEIHPSGKKDESLERRVARRVTDLKKSRVLSSEHMKE